MSEGEGTTKGAFEKFKSDWLQQVAGDPAAKKSTPAVAIFIACRFLNRDKGTAWPSIATLKQLIGASSDNTVREALRVLERNGHALIRRSKGGPKATHEIAPIVNGQPFKKLKGFDLANPSKSDVSTLQNSDQQPFKNLKGNHLIEPLEEPIEGMGGLKPTNANHIPNVNSIDDAPAYAPEGAAVALLRARYPVGKTIRIPNEWEDYGCCTVTGYRCKQVQDGDAFYEYWQVLVVSADGLRLGIETDNEGLLDPNDINDLTSAEFERMETKGEIYGKA